MSRHIAFAAALVAIVGLSASQASATTVELFEWALNIDGAMYGSSFGGTVPAYVNTAAFDFTTGLGQITMTYNPGAGSHNVIGFFDLEIDEAINTFFNEYGSTLFAPSAGQSWEIDEPGYLFGDIFSNVMAGTLDNTNAVPVGSPDDVSVALGWDFALAANQYALITYRVRYVPPEVITVAGPGILLTHNDTQSLGSVLYDSTLTIRETGEWVIPEPVTMAGTLMGLAAVAGYVRRRRK